MKQGSSVVVLVVGGLNMTFWDKMIGFWWERRFDLSLFHSLCRLILVFIWVIVRIFTIQLTCITLTFNAVVVWVLRTNRWAIELTDFIAQLTIKKYMLTRIDWWKKLDYCQNSYLIVAIQEPTVAQRRSILGVSCLENCLKERKKLI